MSSGGPSRRDGAVNQSNDEDVLGIEQTEELHSMKGICALDEHSRYGGAM